MPRLRRNDIVFVQTCVTIPETLRVTAREMGIGLSSTLSQALEEKIKENTGRHTVTRPNPPASPSSTDKQVDNL